MDHRATEALYKPVGHNMNSRADDIIEKMKNSVYPELNFEFIYKLTNESERGAVLIGTSKVEEYLEKLSRKILPSKTKSYTSRLLNYPGALSSFSGKIELLYAFRIIDKRFYNSLNTLRKIRNNAAHSSEEFKLIDLQEEQTKINDFEEDFVGLIEHLALNNLITSKKWKFEKILADQKEESKPYFQKEINKRLENLKDDEDIKEQLRIWILSYGLVFMCLKIMVLIDDLDILDNEKLTWIEIKK